MKFSLRGPRTAAGQVVAFLGCYVAAALIAALMVFVHLPGDGAVIVVSFAVVGALALGHLLTRYRLWLQVCAAFTGATFVIVTGYAAHSTVLAVHGDRISAVVAGVAVQERSGNSTTYRYALTTLLGVPVPGQLVEDSDELAIGEQVEVVVDRGGRVDPRTTGEVDAVGPLWAAALIGFALTALVAVLAGPVTLRRQRSR
ncbi:hypothetical protein [Actinoplanes friuliensis]|uniref:Uncharacterized protein n=1 Tax=Actinoplanes friuliensis DSM 7358 TaxID=1246995 RepID=U5W7D5_9ACTN|nr:hypothetical protein [Actinoplanes friuliensis]AGZ45088.1 hypothetical protein AFR_34150 [Actinoplanes friuliensis DSM 7358]